MKRIIYFALFVLMMVACEKSTNYSAQLATQQKNIQKYISDHNIKLIDKYPADSVFATNEYYYMGQDSIIFRLVKKGVGRKVKEGDRIQIRWVRYSLDGTDSISYWTVTDLSYPLESIYNPVVVAKEKDAGLRSNTNCVGWQSAIRLMGQSDAIADFIVPSPIGTLESFIAVEAYRYKFSFRILPK